MTTKSLLCTSAVLLSGLAPALVGCRNTAGAQMAPIVDGNAAATDPTAANFATPYSAAPTSAPVRYAATKASSYQLAQNNYPQSGAYPQQGQAYPSQGNSQQNEAYRYNTQPPQNGQYNTGNYGVQQGYGNQQGYADPQQGGQYGAQGYDPNAQISDDEYNQYQDLLDPNVPQAQQPPPPLPTDYEQPEAPGDDYLWTPGYWDYASAGYYYVPGAWVAAPYAGALWTPGWWGYAGSGYRWHHGYWGPHVGFYGGVNYGFGYIGYGYQGGYWNNNHFLFNLAVNRVPSGFNNSYTYNRRVTVVNNTYINNSRTSYYGGPGGLRRGPSPQEFAARREQRTPPMQAQIANREAAQGNRQQFFRNNGGRPQMLAASRPLQADRGIQAPQRFSGGNQPGNAGGFNNRPGFVNGNPGNVQGRPGQDLRQDQRPDQRQDQQQRQQFDVQRQQELQGRGGERNQAVPQRDANAQQLNGNLQQRQQFDQQRQQQQLNTQQQPLNQQRQQLQLNNDQQRQQFNQQRQQQDIQRQQQDAQRQQQVQQQRQQQDVQRQQQDAQRQQQFQQQRQQVDQQRVQQDAQRQQQFQQQRQQMDQQRQVQQQQLNQQRQQLQQQHFDAPRPAPAAAPRMEAPRMEAPHGNAPGANPGGGDHHH